MTLQSQVLNQEPEILLPFLRKDLDIAMGAPDEEGAPMWLLYDPLKNAYYRIGYKGFTMIYAWKDGIKASLWINELREKEPDITEEEVNEFIYFLHSSGLTKTFHKEDVKRLDLEHQKARQGIIQKILRNYLYFRIPVFNLDPFLSATLPWVEFFFRPFFKKFVITIGIIGILMIIRQWEIFIASIQYFFNLKGLFFFGITLFFVKAIHELGHGYTAKRYGCRVPSMGIAFLVLYPFLYTDTTDSWRLISKKQRLNIVLAGVKTELAIALTASFLWSFFDEGILKSVFFFLATTSWIASISINTTPFMRFDGYYALSDFLGAENLQSRAFALAKWNLREILFGYKEPPPEMLSQKRKLIFLTYAYSTWIYRFFLFLGIAFLVYHIAFKVLGIILFMVEIAFFILLPIINEFKVWWMKRKNMAINKNIIFSSVLFFFLCTFLFMPWQSGITIPGVLETDLKSEIYPPQKGFLKSVSVKEGDSVKKETPLFIVSMPDLENRKKMLNRKILYLKTRIDRHIGSDFDLKEIDVLQRELAKAETSLEGINKQIDKGKILSPRDGIVSRLIKGKENQWVSGNDLLAEIIKKKGNLITAYVEEAQLYRIKNGSKAKFYYNSGDHKSLNAYVAMVSETAVAFITHMETTSIHGGSIPVREMDKNRLRPETGLYKIILNTDKDIQDTGWRVNGKVWIETEATSPFSRIWKYALSVLIRESGF